MRLRWSQRARSQVREIFEYIARDRPNAAEAVLERFLERIDLLTELPTQGSLWGGGERPDLRQVIHEGLRVVYRVDEDEIAILSIRHTRMDVQDISDE